MTNKQPPFITMDELRAHMGEFQDIVPLILSSAEARYVSERVAILLISNEEDKPDSKGDAEELQILLEEIRKNAIDFELYTITALQLLHGTFDRIHFQVEDIVDTHIAYILEQSDAAQKQLLLHYTDDNFQKRRFFQQTAPGVSFMFGGAIDGKA